MPSDDGRFLQKNAAAGIIHGAVLPVHRPEHGQDDGRHEATGSQENQTRLVLEKVAEAENIQPSEEEITEEIQKMADAYKMEADKIREAIGESGLEQMKKDMAVQKAVTVIADAAVEVEKAADAE